MIVGIGVDIVDLARFERTAARTPKLLDRLFAQSEQVQGSRRMPIHSLAARFAAKEALIKALGTSDDVFWHDMPIMSDGERNPSFALSGGIAKKVKERGITHIHLSLTHDAGVAIAYVIAEAT
ncbi:MAG: holo-ACP synthase [Microbacteriaceae bacterium]|nr:holo-ACP synthase [Microbacteriaceae bacterium]